GATHALGDLVPIGTVGEDFGQERCPFDEVLGRRGEQVVEGAVHRAETETHNELLSNGLETAGHARGRIVAEHNPPPRTPYAGSTGSPGRIGVSRATRRQRRRYRPGGQRTTPPPRC